MAVPLLRFRKSLSSPNTRIIHSKRWLASSPYITVVAVLLSIIFVIVYTYEGSLYDSGGCLTDHQLYQMGVRMNHDASKFGAADESSSRRPSSLLRLGVPQKVPPGGISTTLISTATNPSFHLFTYDPTKDRYISNHLVRGKGLYEPPLTVLVQQLFGSPDAHNYTALDLGANIGFHTLHMAARGARVIAFEASPDTAWLLRSSAALNGFLTAQPSSSSMGGSVTLVAKGVSDESSVGRLYRFPKSPGMTSFAKSKTFDLHTAKAGSALDVDIPLVKAADELTSLGILPNGNHNKNNDIHLRLIKIDVEGFELKALRGLDLTQYQADYVTLEFFPHLLTSAGTDPTDLLVYIWSCGYRFFTFDMTQLQQASRPVADGAWEQFTPTGSTEAEVRAWAKGMVQRGQHAKGDDYHTNLFAKLT